MQAASGLGLDDACCRDRCWVPIRRDSGQRGQHHYFLNACFLAFISGAIVYVFTGTMFFAVGIAGNGAILYVFTGTIVYVFTGSMFFAIGIAGNGTTEYVFTGSIVYVFTGSIEYVFTACACLHRHP